MIRYENECVQCGLPCFLSCPNKSVPHYYCDGCGAEDDVYAFDGDDLCFDCIWDSLQSSDAESCNICGADEEIKQFYDGITDAIPLCKSCVEDKLREGKHYGKF